MYVKHIQILTYEENSPQTIQLACRRDHVGPMIKNSLVEGGGSNSKFFHWLDSHHRRRNFFSLLEGNWIMQPAGHL